MKKIIACLMGLMFLGGVVACGGSDDWEEGSETDSDSYYEESPADPQSTEPGGSPPPAPGIPDLCAGAMCNAPDSEYDERGRPPYMIEKPVMNRVLGAEVSR